MLAVVTATVVAAAAAEIAPEDRRSGYDFAGPDTRSMQDDDRANPGMLGVLQGEALWASKAGATNWSCAECHGDPRTSMKGVAARYPAFEPALARPLDLEGRINRCRTEHQVAEPFAWESEDLLALTTFVAHQSRKLPITVQTDPSAPEAVALELYLMARARGMRIERPAVRP